MKLLPIAQVTPGMVLAKPVLNKNGMSILTTGKVLTQENIEILINKENILSICIFETMEGKNIITSFNDFSSIYRKKLAEKIKALNPEEVYALSNKLVRQIKETPELSWDLLEVRSKDDTIYRHSVSVAILSVSYGIKKGFDEEKLNNLCAAALLHDVGKKYIPENILFKPEALTPEETLIMHEHVTKGYEHLKFSYGIPSQVKIATLLHHENWDGSGYPFGKKKKDIHEFARVIRIADTFDALTEVRVYRDPISKQEACEYIKENAGIFFDPEIVNDFFQAICI